MLGLPYGAQVSHCGGFSCGARVPGQLGSCSTGAYFLCGMWDLPTPGIQPTSPAVSGRFLSTGAPEKLSVQSVQSLSRVQLFATP